MLHDIFHTMILLKVYINIFASFIFAYLWYSVGVVLLKTGSFYGIFLYSEIFCTPNYNILNSCGDVQCVAQCVVQYVRTFE